MTGISEILRSDSVYRLGWALLHSLWQIALLASIVAVLLAALRRRSANLRYLAACGALAAMFILLVATYCLVPGRPAAEAAAGSVPFAATPPISMGPVLPDTTPPEATLPNAPPPEFVPSTPGPEPGVLPLARQPSPEITPSAETAIPLPERVAQAISPWVPWFVLAWFVGVFVLSVWHLGGWIALQRLKYLGTTAGSEPLARRLAELIERMRLGRPVRIFQSVLVDVPAVIGWLRPVLLVPAAMLGAMSPQQIDAVLAHELAHIRRYDYLVNLLQTIIETLLFYHPAIWWLSRRIRLEREHCCDDAAVAVCGNSLDYAAALMAMEQGRMAPRLAVAARGGSTALSRVRRVLNVSGRDPVRLQTSLVGVFTVVALLGLLAGYIATAGEQPQKPDPAAEERVEEEAPGEEAEELAQESTLPADLSLEARVVGIDGKAPQRSSITFWKTVDLESIRKSDQGPGSPGFDDVPHVWHDRATGKTWQPIHHFGAGDQATKEGLEPGDYRVTAFVGRGSPTMLAVSDPVHLRGSRKHTVVTLPIQDGPCLTIEVVDAQTGKPLEYAGIRLVRPDGLPVVPWSSTWSVHPRGSDHTFEHLSPGDYKLEVFKRAYRYGDREYAVERGPIKLRLAANQDRHMTVRLKAVGPGEEEARRRWPWAVTGTVTDGQGRPLPGVQIRASCGMGTLMPTGETLSDQQGNYTLRFGPGMRIRKDDGTWGAGIQAATIFAFKEGHTEKNLCRQGGLLMGDKLPEEGDPWYGQRGRVVVPGKPRRLDFVMVPAASVEGAVVDEQGKPIADKQISVRGKQMLPSTSVLAQGKTDREGRFRFEGVPANYGWWFSVGDQGGTQPITFPGPGSYRVKLQLARYAQYNLDVFRITSVTDPQGNEVSDKLVGDDPSARPPVSEELQEKGRSYLRKMAAACRDWLGPPPAEVQSYEYRFRLGNGEPNIYQVDDASRAAGSIRQGISYFGTPHALASRPEKVVFRQVQVGQETILLRFLVQDAVKISAGNGISGSWAGYFDTPLREGLLVLDKTTYRPVRTDIGNVQETFSRYMGLGKGHFVPLAIRIQKGSTDWNWKFRVYQPGLWLLTEGRSGDPEGQRKPLTRVDEVMINGRLAVPMVEDGTDSGTGAAREVESLQAKIRDIESLCAPANGTLRHAIENRFGKGTPSENADAPRKRGNPGSRYRLYEFCENGSLFICYDAESLAKVVWARYLDPYATEGRAKPPTPEKQLRELTPRLAQMQLILAEYKRRFGEDYKNAWGEAVEGIQVRVRADMATWPTGANPSFQVDIRNRGKLEPHIAYPQSFQVEVDGKRHTANFDASGWPRSIEPGGRLTCALSLGDFLSGEADDPPVGLRRGKHTIRVLLSDVGLLKKGSGGERDVILFGHNEFEAISNPVEIEIGRDRPTAEVGDDAGAESPSVAPQPEEPGDAATARTDLLGAFKAAEHNFVQAEVGKKIIALGDKGVVPEMIKMLDSVDRWRRCNAGRVLAALGHERGLAAVLAELKDTGERPTNMIRSDGKPNVPGQIRQDRYYAVHVLGEIGDTRAVPDLIDVLEDDTINYKAALVLGDLGDRRAVAPLKEMLKAPNKDNALWAGCALAKLKDPVGVPTVASFLGDSRWTYRRHAVNGLGASGDPRAVPHLIEALADPTPDVRVSACEALAKLGDVRALPHLEKLLDDRTVTETRGPTIVCDGARKAIESIRSKGPQWGPAVEGVQCRIQPDKKAWNAGETPTCRAFVRHQGRIEVWLSRVQMPESGLEVDGVWYRHLQERIRGAAYQRSSFWEKAPGGFQFALDQQWVAVEGGKPLMLGPGKHTVRYAWAGFHAFYRGRISPLIYDEERPVRLVSKPVEIEIIADKPAPDAEPAGQPAASVRGRVLDHEGKPVEGAKLFLGGGGLPPVGFFDGSRSTKIRTDKDGRFVIDDPDKRATHVLVAAPSLYVWKSPLPQPGRELEIRLPEPAALKIRYDIQGADDQGQFRLEMKAWEMAGWKELAESLQNPKVPNKSEIVLTGLTPGLYDLARIRDLRGHGLGKHVFCDRHVTLELRPGKTAVVDFVRPKGKRVFGQLVGLPNARLAGAFVYVKDVKATGDPKRFDEWKLTTFGAATTDVQGRFTTARIPPGTYAVIAESYADPGGRLGWPLPDYVGVAKVTVPEEGAPPPVRVEMKTREEFQRNLAADTAKAAGPSAEVYRKHVANLVLPQRDDPYLPSQKWLREHLAGAVPYLLEARIKYKDQFNRIPVVADLLFDAWQQGLLTEQQKRSLLEHTVMVRWELREAYPPGYAREGVVSFRGVIVQTDVLSDPFGPEGLLKATYRVVLEDKEQVGEHAKGRVIQQGETRGSDSKYLWFPAHLQPGDYPLKVRLEVTERAGQWRHSWWRPGRLRIDLELKPESIVAPGSENFPQEKAVRFVEGLAKQYAWDSGGQKFLVTAPAVKIEPRAGFDMDIVARLPIEVEIDGVVYGKPHYYGGYSHIDGHSPPGRQFTFQPSPEVPLRTGKFRWRIVLVPDLHWAWTEPGVDRLCNRKFTSPWYAAEVGLRIADLETFRQERTWGEREKEFEAKLRHFRNALTWKSAHPEKVALEYRVAVMLRQFRDSSTETLPPPEWPRRKEALAMFRGIVERYDHMSYYTNGGAGSWWDAQLVLPHAAMTAASLLEEQGGDKKDAARYRARALEMMNQTCRRRIREWSTAPRPQEPMPGLGGLRERGKHQARVAEWERRKKAAVDGEVLSVSELRVVDGMVPSIDRSRGGRATPEVLARLRQIAETYRGTAIARIAQQRLEAAKGDPDVLLRQLNAGELSDEKIRQITAKVLAIQGDLEQRWDGAWGNWLETARVMGKVSDADFTRYAKQSNPTWKLLALQITREDGKLGVSFGITHFGGRVASATTDHNLIIKHRLVRLRLGDVPIDVGNTGGQWSFVTTTQHGFGLFREKSEIEGLEKLEPGKYEAVLELEATIYEAGKPHTTLHRFRTQVKDELKLTQLFLGSAAGPGASEPTAEDGNDEAWGKPVAGVQCRLEPEKPTWKDDEIPRLKAYVQHQTDTRLFLSNHPSFGAQLEVDGHWHRWNGPMEWAGPSHSSSKFRTEDKQPLKITLDVNWKQVDNKQPLRLDPGRHVVRFAWEGFAEKGPREGPDQQREVVLLSNPVEITILPDSPQPKLADVHPDEKDAAAALQQLGAILAADAQGRIRSVSLSRTSVTDAGLEPVKGLSELKALYLDDTQITDAGLRHVARLTGLETLSVNYTKIGDVGLEHLEGLGRLGSLELLETDVTAAGLRELKKTLPRLQATVDPLKLTGLAELRGWRNSAELSDDYELLSVDLLGPNVADAWLERLRDHRSLQDVCLANAKITDAGLGHLQGLTDLHTLYLSGTQITDRGMEYLKGMKKLRTLFLAETQIGDAGLAHLEGLTNLEMLLINGTRVTDAGMVHLKPLRKLTHLRLNDCQISGAGLSDLRGLTRLTTLELNGTAVSDAGLVHVQPFMNLELLYLSHTSVTDAGLGHLTGLKKLRALMIEHAHVTDQGIKSLKLALPKTSFHH